MNVLFLECFGGSSLLGSEDRAPHCKLRNSPRNEGVFFPYLCLPSCLALPSQSKPWKPTFLFPQKDLETRTLSPEPGVNLEFYSGLLSPFCLGTDDCNEVFQATLSGDSQPPEDSQPCWFPCSLLCFLTALCPGTFQHGCAGSSRPKHKGRSVTTVFGASTQSLQCHVALWPGTLITAVHLLTCLLPDNLSPLHYQTFRGKFELP